MASFRYGADDVVTAGGRTTLKPAAKKASKYRNVKTVVDGIKFDSKLEARHYERLLMRTRAGEICDLQRQVKFVLIKPQVRPDGTRERGVSYIADFTFLVGHCNVVVQDVKSEATRKKPEYVIKRKLMLERYGIAIQEIL